MSIEALIVQKTHRVPAPAGHAGDGSVAARQFDAVLMSAGWKLSRELLKQLSGLSEGTVIDTAVRVLPVVRRMVGDHVQHNVYFRDFPKNVPDTLSFWAQCLTEALLDPAAARQVHADMHAIRGLNLLALPSYGRYLHTYEEMLAAHDDLIETAKDRVTVLHLGGPLSEEASSLYLALAGSRTPLGEDDLGALTTLAAFCAEGPQPEVIPVRENRAIVNQTRLACGAPLLVDTVTDVLRLAASLSGGDVTLQEPTRFRSFPRSARRALLAALDGVVAGSDAKLGDVPQYQEEWKRLGERLHPHEFPQWPGAAAVFAVARGELVARSFNSRVEAALGRGDLRAALALLGSAPGLLFRSLDRLLRTAKTPEQQADVLFAAENAAGKVSGRVLLSVREHLQNRAGRPTGSRVFTNRKGRARAVTDTRPPIHRDVLARLFAVLDAELAGRLPKVGRLVVDPAVLPVALPLSGKATADGFGVLPRGSVSDVDGELLRFFIYWREREERTDYDLSALILDANYANPRQLSWTGLTLAEGEHSGDITSAPNGASEFINLHLGKVQGRFIIPQVNIYSGEAFDEAAEAFFGFMLRDAEQAGQPFEPRTVRMKSDLRGAGRIALPLVFMRGDDGRWRAKWLHLYMRGHASFNQVEGNRVTTGMLVRGIVGRDYLRVEYLANMLAAAADTVTVWDGGQLPDGPVTYVGLERPEGLAEGSEVYTLERLADLIPA